jgi:hypothetical protein
LLEATNDEREGGGISSMDVEVSMNQSKVIASTQHS